MTRTTNATIAGFTFLFYTAVALCSDVLMHHATGVAGDSAKLARFGEYATDVRLAILFRLLECFSALVLAAVMYGITRDQNHELAVLAMVCRVAEGLLTVLSIPSFLGVLWLAKAAVGTDVPDINTKNALLSFLLMPVPSVPLSAIFFAVGSLIFSWLLLRGRIVSVSIAGFGVFATGLLAVLLPLQLAGFNTGPLSGFYQWLPELVYQTALALLFLIKGVATPETALRAPSQDA